MSSGGTASGGTASGEGGSGGENVGPPGDAPCDVPGFIFEAATPDGWASEGGGTTGGGSATPVLVTSFEQLESEVEGDSPKTIYVRGDFSAANLEIGSNKTIVGCSPGAHLRGHIGIGSGSSNVILRNLEISGYGAGDCALDPDYDSAEGCSSGNDAVSVNGDAHHVWFDHCWVKDGTDGNLDITNDANFVTVSWTKFSYTPRTDDEGSDSTGASGHRYSNLVGGTDSEPTGWPETIPLNVTWHHNWWGENVVERQPRVRYGQNHLFNNYYDSNTSKYCVRAGIEASVLLEGNYFEGVESPHEFNSEEDEGTAFIARGEGDEANVYDATSGEQATGGGGDAFMPPYEYALEAAQDVRDVVMAGAGPQ
jgi:pectate lyase